MSLHQGSTAKSELEESSALTPRFDAAGLITAVVSDSVNGAPLMVAHMNAEALRLTIRTGIAHFWSRSRKTLWKKGETSGNFLNVSEILIDCDQDCVWLLATVAGNGAACHTGRRSCFYRRIVEESGVLKLAPATTEYVSADTRTG